MLLLNLYFIVWTNNSLDKNMTKFHDKQRSK